MPWKVQELSEETTKYAVYHVNYDRLVKIGKNAYMYDLDRILFDSLQDACKDAIANAEPNHHSHTAIWKDDNGENAKSGNGIVISTLRNNFYFNYEGTDEIYRLNKDGVIDTSATFAYADLE